MSRCDNCEYACDCDIAYFVNFCEDCKDYSNCPIKYEVSCKAGEYIECNNGFEDKYEEEIEGASDD